VTHEFLFLHLFIEEHAGKPGVDKYLGKAREKATITSRKTTEEQLFARFPCPFLEEGACAVYQARPMACRIYLSYSVEACIESHRNPTDERRFPALFEFPLRAGRMLNEGFVAYLKQSGLKSAELPLEQGYLSMEEQGQTMSGWINLAHGSL
jgi:Fe-S-cluster containining protein